MTDEQKTFTITEGEARLQGCADKDGYRPNLTGVHFDAARNLAVATNGHMLALRRIDGGEPPLGRTVRLKKLKKLKDPADTYRFLQTETGLAVEATGAGSAQLAPEGTTFPEYAQVVPRNREEEVLVSLDAGYLLRIAEAVTDPRTRPWVVLSIDPNDRSAPILVTGAQGAGVLMPCKPEPDEVSPSVALANLVHGGE